MRFVEMIRLSIISSKAAAVLFAAAMAVPMGLSSVSAAAQDGSRGMLLLHTQTENGEVDQALPHLAAQGCEVWRRGSVTVTDGKLDTGSPDRFVLFSCSGDVLGNAENRAILGPILSAKGARAVEGPVLFRATDDAEADVQKAREYIFKISLFNNLDPDARLRDLNELNDLAKKRVDTWQVEAIVSVAGAVGMMRPDIVTVIYYDNPDQGERFRSNNKDVLKEVGKFNKAHLEEFTYVAGLPD